VLWEIQIEGLRRYRCRVGHAWSPESLLTQQSEALEAALWIALRTLEERAALARRLAEPARRRGHSITATRFEEQATEAQHAARLLRNLLLDRGSLATAWPRPPSTTRRIRPLRRRRPGYADKQVEGVPQDLLGRYFERNGGGYVFSRDLRRSVIFGRRDLIQDAPSPASTCWSVATP
jgi:hypothetical protein